MEYCRNWQFFNSIYEVLDQIDKSHMYIQLFFLFQIVIHLL